MLILAGCSGSGFSLGTPSTPAATESIFTIENIGSPGTLSTGGQPYQLVKLTQDDEPPTFAQWVPNTSGTKGPVLVFFMPYEGIDWTSLTLDATWAARGTGVWADTEGPYYNAATSAPVHYSYMNAPDFYYPAFPFIYNNISVLAIYGRYYSGAHIKTGARDVVSGLKYLKTQALVDLDKVAIYGASWGGFTSLYGMASSEHNVTLAAAAFLYPMSDARQAYQFAYVHVPSICSNSTKLDEFYDFFDPYLRRINKSSEDIASDPDRYKNYSQEKLAGITTPMFIAHDVWDTIVPKTMSDSLIALLPNSQSRHYFHMHTTSLDFNTADVGHTQLSNETMDEEGAHMWARLFIINKLKPSQTRYIDYLYTSITAQFQRTRQMKLAGQDTSFYTPLLKELCDSNITMKEGNSAAPDMTGPEGLAYLYTTYITPEGDPAWASVTSANVCTLMDTNPSVF
jgi:hypothetical protein